jgi:hypothetical protein
LAAILMVAVRRGIQAAQKSRAASHMRQIILAYESYIQGWGGELETISIDPSGTAHDWIAELAKRGYLNDPRLVAFDFDPLVSQHTAAGFFGPFFGAMPPQIWDKSSSDFGDGFENMPLSLCFVANLNTRKTTAHTPLLWTRGLNGDGTWNSREGSTRDGNDGGIWGDSGGLIGFIGGRVEWFPSLTGEHALPTYDGSSTTSNVWKAVNDDAWAVDWKGTLTAFGTSSDGNGIRKIDCEEVLGEWGSILEEIRAIIAHNIYEWHLLQGNNVWAVALNNLADAFHKATHNDPTYAKFIKEAVIPVMSILDPEKSMLPPEFYEQTSSTNVDQLNNLRDKLNSIAQGLTEDEQANYNTYVALYEDLPALVGENSSNAASITKAYLNEHTSDDNRYPRTGSMLAIAILTVDLLIYQLESQF